ncbi:MAG TPA: TraB/GumN family protein [Bacteroidales bacterium]|nr:TraB/GumN family protein [Bacteroidales bacterium]
MKRKLYLLGILAILFVIPTNAQLLWKISGNDLEKPSYLFGTHHLIEKDKIKDFDKALEYYRAADVTIGELDMGDKQSMTMTVMQAGMMNDSTYRDLLSEEDYALVDNELKSLMGVGLE